MEKQELSELRKKEGFKRSLALVEAALYVAGRPLDLKTLASVIRTRSKNKVRRLVRVLLDNYKSRETALEVLELKDERFVLQLKAGYTPRVRRLAVRPLLSRGPLKTLSYIAYRQPVLQPQVIDVRGNHAYSHLKELQNMGLISRERTGRTKMIRTTEFFADYFGLSHDLRAMKRQLKRVFDDFAKPEAQEKEA